MAVVFRTVFSGDAALKLGCFQARAVIKSQVLLSRLVACHRHRLADDPGLHGPAFQRGGGGFMVTIKQDAKPAVIHIPEPARGSLAYRGNTRRVVG